MAQGRSGGKPGKASAKSTKKASKAAKTAKTAKPSGASKAAKPSKPSKAAKAAGGGAGAATRAERLEAARRRRQRRGLFLRLGIGAAALAVIGAIVVVNASSRSVIAQLTSGPGKCRHDTRFDGTTSEQERHVPNPSYRIDPPAGGAHQPSPAAPGFYKPDDVPSDGMLVHAMEHGFVVLWYRPDLGPEDLEEIERLSDRLGRELIVAPRSSLRGEVAVTSWHRRLLCQSLDPEAVILYTTSFKDQGREKGFL